MGTIQGGVRWKTVTCAAIFANSGTTCTPLAPVPITATFLPVRSTRVIPLRGVHERAAEVVQAGDIGQLRRAEQADGADHDVGGQRGGLPARGPARRSHARCRRSSAAVRTVVPSMRWRRRSKSSATDSR